MNEKSVKAVNDLIAKSASAEKPDDAMKFAQAALNTAHAIATLEGVNR